MFMEDEAVVSCDADVYAGSIVHCRETVGGILTGKKSTCNFLARRGRERGGPISEHSGVCDLGKIYV